MICWPGLTYHKGEGGLVAKRSKYQGFGTIAGVKRVLWHILQQVSERMRDQTTDDESRRNWANTGIQASLAYAKIHESHDLETQVRHLEGLAHGNGHHP
jgi:hypothetical protein